MKIYESYTFLYPVLIVYCIFFSIGMAGASFPWVPETLPPVGVGVCWFFQWLVCAVMGKFLAHMISGWPGVLGLVTFFSTVCTFGCLILDYITFETKGKTQKQIEYDYNFRKYRPFSFD